jgi:exodeoxyribonuclease VII small subunit
MPSDVDVSSLSYEEALADLEALITRLERGDVDLDEAVAFYQRGSALAQRCAALLDRTEATVMQLVVGGSGVEEERPLATLPVAEERAEPAGQVRGKAAGTEAERPVAPPPPGSPARARSVTAPSTERTPPPGPAPAHPATPPPAAPQLLPGLDPAPRAPGTGGPEGDFDLDDIPF